MKQYSNIFVTVGTTKFNKLCSTVLSPESIELFKSLGCQQLVVQIGNDESEHDKYDYKDINVVIYRFKDNIIQDIKEADLVISHAGAGTCLEVLDHQKPLLVVVNTDLMNNHQTEIAEKLAEGGHLYYCTCATFEFTLKNMDFGKLKPYQKADATPLFAHLDKLLGFSN